MESGGERSRASGEREKRVGDREVNKACRPLRSLR